MIERRCTPLLVGLFGISLLVACSSPPPESAPPTESAEPEEATIDERSYQLGVIGGFAEVVGVGVKRLALSSPMSPEDMDALMEEAEAIIARNDALSYRDRDFLVTDLFPSEITEGKHVILIYKDPVLDEYQALKERKEELVEAGEYEGEARKNIAREMGRLLSYPDARIERMLSGSE